MCAGHTDSTFVSMLIAKKGKIVSPDGEIACVWIPRILVKQSVLPVVKFYPLVESVCLVQSIGESCSQSIIIGTRRKT